MNQATADTVTLTTPDITNTVTTPGLIDIMTKNGMVVSEGHSGVVAVSEAEQQFNQFSLQSQQLHSGMVMTAPQTITTQIEHRYSRLEIVDFNLALTVHKPFNMQRPSQPLNGNRQTSVITSKWIR